jgi:hypothetical protein
MTGIVGHTGLLMSGAGPGIVCSLPFQGPNASTVFNDETGRLWTATGNAQISTAQAPTGSTSSLFCDGTGDWISTTNSNAFKMPASAAGGVGDFEIECDLRLVGSGAQQIFAHFSTVSGTNGGIGFNVDASRRLQLSRAGVAVVVTGATTLTQNTWYRVRGRRIGGATNNVTVDINGVQDGQATYTGTWQDSGSALASIGAVATSGMSPLNGYIAQFLFRRF